MGKKILIFASSFFFLGILAGLLYVPESGEIKTENKSVITSAPVLTPTPTFKPAIISIIFVGDIMLSRSVGDKIRENNDFSYPFREISDFLKDADLTFGNLENPVSSRGTKVGSIYSFRADPGVASGLSEAGFDVVSLANNHIWDYGRDAFLDTLMHLRDGGIDYVGAGNNFNEVHNGVIKEINGTKIGFLAYTNLISSQVAATGNSGGIAYLNREQMITDIKNIKTRSDLAVISFHWGDEYQKVHNKIQEDIGHIAVDAGADLIIGHHPHVVQDLEQYKERWIVYSLGNFVFDQAFSVETMEGLALRIDIEDKKITGLERIPVKINRNYQPAVGD